MINKILIEKEKQLHTKNYIQFSEIELSHLKREDIKTIEEHFHGHALMLLPESEIEFFEWLKKADREVWDDLWSDDETPYLVSSDFLHHFIEDGKGFPICDLVNVVNFWFCDKHIKPNGKMKFETINNKLNNEEKLTVVEAMILEIATGSTDLWHICFKYKFPVSKAKLIISEMQKDNIIVHLENREDLVKYLDV